MTIHIRVLKGVFAPLQVTTNLARKDKARERERPGNSSDFVQLMINELCNFEKFGSNLRDLAICEDVPNNVRKYIEALNKVGNNAGDCIFFFPLGRFYPIYQIIVSQNDNAVMVFVSKMYESQVIPCFIGKPVLRIENKC